jgi:hypothetical protein
MVGPFLGARSMPVRAPSGEHVVQVLGCQLGMLAV